MHTKSQENDPILKRNNVKVFGSGGHTLMLAHGFGCDQKMWRFMLPFLEKEYQIVLFDYVGCGQSDFSAYDNKRYQTLEGYANDVIEICETLELEEVVFVGHSVSSVIGILASIEKPEIFSKLIMVCPSPCFLNFPPEYLGGFEKEDLEELINLMDKNYIRWANYLAPLVMGQDNDTTLVNELESSFCSTDPKYAKPFAQATFFSDYRGALSHVVHPSLILQSSEDSLASIDIGSYMQRHMPNSMLSVIKAQGHCLHMTKPEIVAQQLMKFVL
ncbi:sigma factor SigB regulation protein RsbQ [Oleiphilus sp. HI0118]|uniref:alpha/beta fold hydrolase n=1 Tax=Oleiphilus sp. HI0079 TaxID=1822254 RepID=UPI0007C24370|nr:alpha/beta hydrolase [Oleiphilus sp. HI0079]KZZ11173.1 sigma factor SigB regulation protein RsbQ [Oleiphilus sp. HI0079]KZZ43685.1 sigma factor SigB regulation protein RsbQ [Oleiphilus sp. HI0118]KZZ78654.1 sigma factor SigB regulation protein RsbQ [Oleiphilus sp. HI0133]